MTTYVTDQMRAALAKHQLRCIQSGEVTAFYLEDPKQGRMMSTLLTFSPEGITITGDFTPRCMSGNISNYGYGIDWFGSRKSENYLCEKFLSREWVAEYAVKTLREEVHEIANDICFESPFAGPTLTIRNLHVEALKEVTDSVEDEPRGPEMLFESLEEIGYFSGRPKNGAVTSYSHDHEDMPGYGYEPQEAGRLCAIQQRFAELWQEDCLASVGDYRKPLTEGS